MTRERKRAIITYIFLVPTAVILALPVLWIVLLSFRSNAVIVRGLASVTSPAFIVDNYVTLFSSFNIPRYIGNSLIASVIPALVSVVVGVFAGYALVRFRFAGRRLLLAMPLFAQLVPLIQLAVPLYVLMLFAQLLDTYTAVIVAHLALVLPFSIWMMTGYLQSVPVDLEEAAMIDGCSRVGAVLRIVIPVAMPGIVATFVYAFLETWGEFLIGYLLTSKESMRLLSVAVYTLIPGAQSPTSWGVLFAAATIFMLPSLILFILLQRTMRQGAANGAIAGM